MIGATSGLLSLSNYVVEPEPPVPPTVPTLPPSTPIPPVSSPGQQEIIVVGGSRFQLFQNTNLADTNIIDITGSGQCGTTCTMIGGTSVQPVPEPLTILGSVAALGFGAYAERKRKLSNSSEKDSSKDS